MNRYISTLYPEYTYSRIYTENVYVQCSNLITCPKCLIKLRLQTGTASKHKCSKCNTIIELQIEVVDT